MRGGRGAVVVAALAVALATGGALAGPGSAEGTSTTVAATTTTAPPATTPLPWPAGALAAAAIPTLRVAAASPHQHRKPIASLTKMMTAWVVLHALPISPGQNGRCLRVTAADMTIYDNDQAEGQSSVPVKAGVRMCELTLLTGMLVHSAGNYAVMLERLVGLSGTAFVAAMNADARALGLTKTHYVDATGLNAGDVSTALDQVTLAGDLMDAEPVVRTIVRQPEVSLPVAGVEISYTPFVGQGGVIGVKSGYTIPAGGCDAMAVAFRVSGHALVVYAVVLGVQGGESINRAGDGAMALAQALRRHVALDRSGTDARLVWTGAPGDVVATTTTTVAQTTTTG